MPSASGYIDGVLANRFGFLPKSASGGSNRGLYDYYYQNTGVRVALFGGIWFIGLLAGAFCWNLITSSDNRARGVGARLLYKKKKLL